MKRNLLVFLFICLLFGLIPGLSVKANLLALQNVNQEEKEMTQKYQVRVSMNQAAIIKSGLVLKQGDFGMDLEIEVLNFDVANTTPQIVFRKPMGAVESTSVTRNGNIYTYTLRGTELDTPGKVICDLKLKNSTTQRISSASFSFEVVADTLDGLNEQASSYSDTISELCSQLEKSVSLYEDNVKELDIRDEDKFDAIADFNINYLTDGRKIEGELYRHNTIDAEVNPNTKRFTKIAIKKDVTYYYKNIWAYFSTILYADGTVVALDDRVDTRLSGTVTALNDGYIYITVLITQEDYLFTDSQALYNSGNWISYAILNAATIVNDAILFNMIGFKQRIIFDNLFNKETAVEGYINYNSGAVITPSGTAYRASDFIPVSPNSKYSISSYISGAQTAFYDADKVYISGILHTGDVSSLTFVTPANTKYLRTTTNSNNLNGFAVCAGEKAVYSTYKEKTALKTSVMPYKITIVDKQGGGDYNTVTEAVSNAVSGEIIFVKNGIYDGEEIEAWGKNISIIGEDKYRTIIQNGINTYSRPPLEMASGLLRNVTIYAYDGGEPSLDPSGWLAYGIHADNLSGMTNQSLVIDNCIIKCDKSAAIGLGMSKGCTIEISNSFIFSRDNFAFFWHDAINTEYVGIQNITCRDSIIKSQTQTKVMKVDSECKEGATVNCSFYRNILASDAGTPEIWTVNQTSGGASTIGTFLDLVNFYKTSECYLNNIESLNN